MYILKRMSDGKYVSKDGSVSSYTNTLTRAKLYSTKEQAARDKCGNEYIISIDSILVCRKV